MHECPGCGQACDCDGEDHWNDDASEDCEHDCDEDEDIDGVDYDDLDDAPCIGAECANPHPDHRRRECETVEMYREYATSGYWARRRRFRPRGDAERRSRQPWPRNHRHGHRLRAAAMYPAATTRAERARLMRADELQGIPFPF